MASFIEDFWNSVFTPGPTPTLLYATNIAFGTLLVLLLALLIATWSVHFLVLSILSTGLWWAINWFAREVRLAQAREESIPKKDSQPASLSADLSQDPSGDVMDSGDDTETELDDYQRQRETTPQVSTPAVAPTTGTVNNRAVSSATEGSSTLNTSAGARLAAPDKDKELKKRQRQSMAESTGSLSTDSEWEKVDDEQQ